MNDIKAEHILKMSRVSTWFLLTHCKSICDDRRQAS
jgi:hypothetical protein